MYNKATLIGNVGKDPEIRVSDIGEFATFTLATSEKWKDKQGNPKEATQWHSVVVYNEQTVNYIKSYVKKGSKLHVEGQITYRKWSDKSGNDRISTDIKVDRFRGSVLNLTEKPLTNYGSEQSQNGHINMNQTDQVQGSAKGDLDDEIPF